MTRTPKPCPRCGGPARAASYRGAKATGSNSGKHIPIGRNYCPACDYLAPREK